MAVTALKPWDKNPRWISDTRFADLVRSLAEDPEMLWARPLLVLPDGKVICGNKRLRAAIVLGGETIPVIVVDLDPQRATLWALRDNNPYGEWDEPKLAELLAELDAGDVDLALTGFPSSDVDRILAGIEMPVDPDEAPTLPDTPPDSQPGEIYELGPYRLL